jgi:hypothetical protein
MAWVLLSPGRWEISERPTPKRQLLLLNDGELIELHGEVLHVYTAPESIEDMTQPLSEAVWSRTIEAPGIDDVPDEEVWDEMITRAQGQGGS